MTTHSQEAQCAGKVSWLNQSRNQFRLTLCLNKLHGAQSRFVNYPVEDNPAHTMVMLKLLDSNTVEQTNKREGKIVSVLRLTVHLMGKPFMRRTRIRKTTQRRVPRCGNRTNEPGKSRSR
jgi:hypothetical protein